jgi:hypothetical protein
MPELSPEQAEELFQLYSKAINAVGITPKEARTLQTELRERLQTIWNAEPRPMPLVFDDFRRVIGHSNYLLESLSPEKADPKFALHGQRGAIQKLLKLKVFE